MKTTFWKLATIFTAVLCLTVFGAALSPAQGPNGGGPPEDKGPPPGSGGGPPAGTMLDVRGCAYFDETLGVWRLRMNDPSQQGCLPEDPETDWKIDFGPEGYCPDPCLTGEEITDQLDGTNPVTIRIGKNLVGTFRWSDDLSTILAETDEDGPAREDGIQWIPLTPSEDTNYGRPEEGKWTRVYGRAGETPYAVLVWEMRYNWLPNGEYENWYWWRSTGQPWAKMQLLDCEPMGEE